MERTYAVVLAGGKGLRLNNNVPKQFLPLGDRPVIAWSLQTFAICEEIDHILPVLPDRYIHQAAQLFEQHSIRKILNIVPGGNTRQESARNALAAHPFDKNDIILFHDAARPFIKEETVRACVRETRAHGAAGVYVPVRDTVADIRDMFVASVPARDTLYYAQTPQGFRFSIINAAHLAALRDGISATDDVSLVRAAGFMVKMVEGDYSNFKITTGLDYEAACRYVESDTNKS
jgi:2-C-methyl-D-erythritol 4-phosphate cytidylyltransferase